MKKSIVIVVLALTAALLVSCASKGGLTKEQKADRKYVNKELRKLYEKGWKAPIDSHLEYWLLQTKKMTHELDENGRPKYIYSEVTSIGESYDAARFMALVQSKLELAGEVETQIAQLIDAKLADGELSKKEAASLTESAAASKSLVAQKLRRVITPINIYRDLPDGTVEVRVMTMYSRDLLWDSFIQTMSEDLEKKADELGKQLDGILKL